MIGQAQTAGADSVARRMGDSGPEVEAA